MSVVVIKSKKKELDPSNPLHRIQLSIPWPEGAVSAYRPHIHAPWQYTTKSDIQRGKIKRMEQHLWWKREHGVIEKKPLYVWVFYCPGINGFFYRGWWINIIGRSIEYGSKRLRRDEKMISRLMDLFPLVEKKLFGPPDIEKWKKEFVRKYQRGFWCGKPQGKAPIWAEVEGNKIVKIIGVGQWLKGLKVNK